MARVDFYLLASNAAEERDTFACRLAEKAWQQGYRVFLRTQDEAATQRLDERLWTFREASFVPHATLGEADGDPVIVGETPPTKAQVEINLGSEIDPDWRGFDRIAELVTQAAEDRQRARERYRAYRQTGVEPVTHTIEG